MASAATNAAEAIRDNALDYFGGQGFVALPPLDMITGDDFNGGLRYDETRPEPEPAPFVVAQPAARIDDIAERERPGVLAGFNMLGLGYPEPGDPDRLLAPVMRFLVDERELDPERMLFVSTEDFRPLIGAVDGVTEARFVERPIEDARAAGDGSGFFAPKGHPHAPAYATVGLYYPLPGTNPGPAQSHPPEGYIEIGEIGIAPLGGDTDTPTGGALGLERLAMAEGEPVPDFGDSRLNLLRIIEDEARREGKELPPGYTMFASL